MSGLNPAPVAAAPHAIAPPPALLNRSRLVRRLEQLPAGGAALVVAPAGYGATTLLQLLVDQAGVASAWCSAPARPWDRRQFWLDLRASLRSVGVSVPEPPLGEESDSWLEYGVRVGRLLGSGRELLVVVDDLGTDPALDGQLQPLLDALPGNVKLLIRARRKPHLDVSRCLAGGRLILLDRWDLALTDAEADEYLKAIAPDLTPARRAALTRIAEGWIGALRAAVTGTGGNPDTDPAVWLLGPGLDLLYGRWLAGLDPAAADLLVRSSVLDVLTPDACDRILGVSGSSAVLSRLSEELVAVPPEVGAGLQYRVHGLLQEYLRRQLAARGSDAVRLAHHAAGRWLADQGDFDSAITHLLDSGQIQEAREVLGAHIAGLLNTGGAARVRSWYRRAPELALPEHEALILGAAWAEVLGGNVAAAGPHLQELEAAAAALAPAGSAGTDEQWAAGLAWLITETRYLRAYLDAWTGHTQRARKLLAGVRASYAGAWKRASHQSSALMGVRIDLWHADFDSAREQLLAVASRPGTNEFFRSISVPALGAVLAAEEGRAHRAQYLADRALGALGTIGAIGVVDDADARLGLARALVDLADPVAAQKQAGEVEQRAASVGHVTYQVLGAAARARALAALGEGVAAGRAIDRARQVLRQHAAGEGLMPAIDRAAVLVAVECGDRAGARRCLSRIPAGQARDRLAIRVAGMGGSLSESDAVRLVRSVRPVTPRDVVDARMLMAAVTAPRPAEAEMHVTAAANVAYDNGMIRALSGRSEEVLVLFGRLAERGEDQAIMALAVAAGRPAGQVVPTLPPLSSGERDLLERLASPVSNRDLAAELGITVNTLKTRLRRLYAKLGVHDRAAALRRAGTPS